MHYEINVSINGQHFFATDPRSCRDEGQARAVYAALRKFLPTSDGYLITVTRWDSAGTNVSIHD